jgi:hypothetical protein
MTNYNTQYDSTSYYNCGCIGENIPLIGCSGEYIPPPRCYRCVDNEGGENNEQRQRKIWNVSRVQSSLYTMNKGAQNVVGGENNKPKPAYENVNWNQMSDRAVPGIVKRTMQVPRRRTRAWPGKTSAPGSGVDVKHDSYARYLARLKAPIMRTKKDTTEPDDDKKFNGNKYQLFGFIPKCEC